MSSIPSFPTWTVWPVIFFLTSLRLILIQINIHLYVSQVLLPLFKRVILLSFLRMVVRKVSMFFCLVSSCPLNLNIEELISFFQRLVCICCLFREEFSALTGYGFYEKQLLHVNYEELLCRCMWARELKYWHNNCEK